MEHLKKARAINHGKSHGCDVYIPGVSDGDAVGELIAAVEALAEAYASTIRDLNRSEKP